MEGDCTWTSPEGETDSQCHRVRFGTTPPMSSYLLAFIVGGYLSVDEGIQSVYTPYSFADEPQRAQFALDQSIAVLDVLEGPDGFNRNFTDSGVPKLDSIGVTDFAAGGMLSIYVALTLSVHVMKMQRHHESLGIYCFFSNVY